MNKNKIRWGILSTASIVPRFIKAMECTEDGSVCAIASRSLEKAEKTAKEYNIENAYDDYHKILEDETIDAVYIPLVNSLHYSYAKEALLAGKHTIVEKPFVLHESEAKELKQIAEEKHLFLSEAVKTPYLPVYEPIKEIIQNKTYGEIHYMEFRQSYIGGSYLEGWNKQKEYGGGVLYGNEAYYFHMAEYLCSKVVSVSGSATSSHGDAEDQCSINAVLENGAIAQLAVSTKILFENGLKIYLDDALIQIPDYWKAQNAKIIQNGKVIQEFNYPCEYELQYELNHYHKCIQEAWIFSPITPVDHSIRYIGFCEKLYQSWE